MTRSSSWLKQNAVPRIMPTFWPTMRMFWHCQAIRERAFQELDRAIQLNPEIPDSYCWNQATILFQLERYEEAISAIMRMKEIAPALGLLAASHAMSGNNDEARHLAQKVRAIYPDFSATRWVSSLPIRDPIIRSAYEHGLRKSGLH